MSEPIGPGDWVECVREPGPLSCVRLGDVVVVDALCLEPHTDGEPGLLIRGDDAESVDCCACHHFGNFRPIYRPKASFIESLKTPAPAKGVPA